MKTAELLRPKEYSNPHLNVGREIAGIKQRDSSREIANIWGSIGPGNPGFVYAARESIDWSTGDRYRYVTRIDKDGNAKVMAQRTLANGVVQEVREGGYDKDYGFNDLQQKEIDFTPHQIINNTTGRAYGSQIVEWGVSGVKPTPENSTGPNAAQNLEREFELKQQIAFRYDKNGRLIGGPGIDMPMPVRIIRNQHRHPEQQVPQNPPTQPADQEQKFDTGWNGLKPEVEKVNNENVRNDTLTSEEAKRAKSLSVAWDQVFNHLNSNSQAQQPIDNSRYARPVAQAQVAPAEADPNSLLAQALESAGKAENGTEDIQLSAQSTQQAEQPPSSTSDELQNNEIQNQLADMNAQIEGILDVITTPNEPDKTQELLDAVGELTRKIEEDNAARPEEIRTIINAELAVLITRISEQDEKIQSLSQQMDEGRQEYEANIIALTTDIAEKQRIIDDLISTKQAPIEGSDNKINEEEVDSTINTEDVIDAPPADDHEAWDTEDEAFVSEQRAKWEAARNTQANNSGDEPTEEVEPEGLQTPIPQGLGTLSMMMPPHGGTMDQYLNPQPVVMQGKVEKDAESSAKAARATDVTPTRSGLNEAPVVNPKQNSNGQKNGKAEHAPWETSTFESNGNSAAWVEGAPVLSDFEEFESTEEVRVGNKSFIAEHINEQNPWKTLASANGVSKGWTKGAPVLTVEDKSSSKVAVLGKVETETSEELDSVDAWVTGNGGYASDKASDPFKSTDHVVYVDPGKYTASQEIFKGSGLFKDSDQEAQVVEVEEDGRDQSSAEVELNADSPIDVNKELESEGLAVIRRHGGRKAAIKAEAKIHEVLAGAKNPKLGLLSAYGIDAKSNLTPEAIIESLPSELRILLTPQKINGFNTVYRKDPLRAKNKLIEYLIIHGKPVGLILTEEDLDKYFI